MQRLQNRHRHIHADNVAGVDGCGIAAIDDRAFGCRHANGGEAAIVVGQIGIEAATDRKGRVGVRVVHHHVDAARRPASSCR